MQYLTSVIGKCWQEIKPPPSGGETHSFKNQVVFENKLVLFSVVIDSMQEKRCCLQIITYSTLNINHFDSADCSGLLFVPDCHLLTKAVFFIYRIHLCYFIQKSPAFDTLC